MMPPEGFFSFESFDYTYQPSLDPKRIKELSACRWVANGENVVCLSYAATRKER